LAERKQMFQEEKAEFIQWEIAKQQIRDAVSLCC
jgi:hypothetical protein